MEHGYVVSQICDEKEFETTVLIHQGQLYLRVHGVNMSLEMETLCKSKYIFKCNFLVFIDCNLFQIDGIIWIPSCHRKKRGLCGNIIAVITYY